MVGPQMHLVFVFRIYESLVWFSEGILDCDVFKLSSSTTVPNFTLSTPLCVSFCPQNIENSFKVNDNNGVAMRILKLMHMMCHQSLP